MMPMMWNYGFWGWFGMTAMMLGWLALLALVVWALVRAFGGQPLVPARPQAAQDILRQRYARGEIDTTTYDEMRARLEDELPGPATPREPVGTRS